MIWPPPNSEARKEQPKRRGGRKPKYDWDALHAECLRRIDDDGLPSNPSELTKNLLEWCQQRFGEGGTPEFETARKYVARWIAGWDRSLPA